MENLYIYKNTGILALCYFFGAIPFCYIIAKIHSRKDLTKIGDKNPGGWNLIFCAAIAGHDYSPYLKFSGGKGVASTLGVLFAISPLAIVAYGAGITSVLFLLRNMIWGVVSGIIFSGIFLWIFKSSPVYLILVFALLIIVIPKYINHSILFHQNFIVRKEKNVKDLFTPKIR
jgi:glycerol-3-phosphate acyltransferase PlsY